MWQVIGAHSKTWLTERQARPTVGALVLYTNLIHQHTANKFSINVSFAAVDSLRCASGKFAIRAPALWNHGMHAVEV
jgi:hypothetical protein